MRRRHVLLEGPLHVASSLVASSRPCRLHASAAARQLLWQVPGAAPAKAAMQRNVAQAEDSKNHHPRKCAVRDRRTACVRDMRTRRIAVPLYLVKRFGPELICNLHWGTLAGRTAS